MSRWQVEVLNPDETPANGVPVVVGPGNVEGHTAADGMAKLTIDTVSGGNLVITVSLRNCLRFNFYIIAVLFWGNKSLKYKNRRGELMKTGTG